MWTNSCCSHPMNISSEIDENDFCGTSLWALVDF